MTNFTRLIVAISLFVNCTAATCQHQVKLLNEQQAHEIARSTLTLTGRNLANMKFAQEPALRAGKFYWFTMTADVPNDASPIMGGFAVNQMTGDVWDPVSCRKLVSGNSVAMQRRLMSENDLTTKEVARFSKTAPCER